MMRPGGGSLRARLIALLLATLIPLVGLGIYWIVMEVRQEQARMERDAQKTAALVSAEVRRLVSGVQGMLAVVARLPAVQRPDRTEAARLFREILANSTHLENVILVGADGVVLASAVPVPPIGPIHLEDRDWFQRSIRSGQPAVGGYQVGRVAGKPIAVLSHPVVDNTGRVTAVVAAGLRLAAVSQEVAPARIKAPVVWAVADAQDLVLLHSEPWGAIGRPLGPLAGMSRAEAVVPGTPWRAVVGIPEATVAAALRQVLPVVGLPALLVLLAAGGVALWLARDIWRPLQALTATVRRIGAGDREFQLPARGANEVGEVAVALQDALGAVAAREANIARRNEELAALVDATQVIVSSLDLQEILRAIVSQAASISGTPILRLFLLDEETQVLRYRVGLGLPLEVEQSLVIPVGESFSGQVAATGRPVAVADCRGDSRLRFPEHALKYGLISYLGLPVKLGGRVLGVLVFNTKAPRVYSEEEIAYLSTFADHAAIAIENARLYDTIQHHAADLEARVLQRTAELEEALRVRVEFLGKMSHELRTPLNFVIGFSELLQQRIGGPLTPKQATYVDRVLSGGKRLLSLVNDVLDIAQLDAGRSRLHLEPVILGPLVQEVLGLVQIQATQKRLKVTTALTPWLPFIVADRFKLAQILHNLVGNAVKFTPEDGSITIITRQVPAAGDGGSDADVKSSVPRECVELVVEDTGIGIRPENLGAIFEAFYQVDGSETRAQGGAGLGLALVRKLVELHGGRVWAERPGPGQGSRFVVRLPRLEVPKAKRILLVEDEMLIRVPMASALESAGFVVMEAVSGADALAAMEAAAPDLLILDILLPDLDGWEVLRQVREAEEIRTLPVLVVSGLESVNAERALALGADEFLTKPVSPRVLVDTVVRLLAQFGVGSAATGPSGGESGENPGM